MSFDVQVVHHVSEIDQVAWDNLGGGCPFSSHRWYQFGETVMEDCIPVYIILSRDGQMIARATFWVIRNEPLPIPWMPLRYSAHAVFHRWPLFICRSPLANITGLVLPDLSLQGPALEAILAAAVEEAKKHTASFLLFDFLDEGQAGWMSGSESLSSYSFSDPGTQMQIIWTSFDSYLASLSPKARKHYRQHKREAERLGIEITRQDSVPDIEEVLPLIRDVEYRHRSSSNPWTRNMLENLELARASWLTVKLNGRIVGCELILEDNGTQMITSLGLMNGISHIYHLLGYADIQYAIESGAHYLRWGSGSYETKQRLGFSLEKNNHVVFRGLNPLTRLMARIIS
jgi:predicted N-acyltransferase